MKNITFKSLLLLSAASMAGCMSSPIPRLYLLQSKVRESALDPNRGDRQGSILLRSVGMADYLNRPQIIIRKGEREVAHAEFDRWAEPLKIQAHNYLSDALGLALPAYSIKSSGWGEKIKPLFEIGISILLLDGAPEESVRLRANWQIFSVAEEMRIIAEGKSDLSAACSLPGIPGMVAATEAVLEQLSHEIATAFTRQQAPEKITP